jgi:hypothetical protein
MKPISCLPVHKIYGLIIAGTGKFSNLSYVSSSIQVNKFSTYYLVKKVSFEVIIKAPIRES